MKYYSYDDYRDNEAGTDNSGAVVTKSEAEILEEYWPYWSERMIEKYGKEVFEKNWSKQDCIDDWVVINWARESKNESD